MTIAVMRNRVSTEFRKVEHGTDEYLDLQAQRDPHDGRPVWEETGMHDAIEQSQRLESGNPLPVDFGDKQQPVGRIAGTETFVPSSSVHERLPSEIEAGIEGDVTLTSMPPREDVAEEQPLVAGMESATDTDTSATEPSLEDAPKPSGASGSKMEGARSRRAKDEAPKDESTTEQQQP